MKIYFCKLTDHFPSIARTKCLIYLITHKEALAKFSEWLCFDIFLFLLMNLWKVHTSCKPELQECITPT